MVSKKKNILGIIMARGGSKGLPHKNIKALCQRPLISFSIASGLQSKLIDKLIVSTDDNTIAKIAQQYGAEVPFIRPAELAQDNTTDLPVIKHALDHLASHQSYHADIIVQLRPTSPLREAGLIDRAIEMLLSNNHADSLRGVTTPAETPYKMWKKNSDGWLEPIIKSQLIEPYNMPRQQLPQALWQTGHIDVIRRKTIREKNSLSGEKILPIYIDPVCCIDIDTENDLKDAEKTIHSQKLDLDIPPYIDNVVKE